MASIKTAPPSRPLPPPPSPLVLPVHSQPYIRASMPVSNAQDASKLGVPTNPRLSASGRASPQPSQALPMPPLGPPPSLPLPDLPTFPSPVIHQGLNTRVRTIDVTPLRPSLPKRVSDHIISESSPASPTGSIRPSAEFAACAHVARRVASSASLGKRSARPVSTASVWSIASGNSHLSAANEALGQSMAELDRDADAMGILLSSSSSRADSSSRSSHSRSLGSSSGKRRGSWQRPSLTCSNSAPVIVSLNGEQPSTQPSWKQSNSTPLLAGSLRKVSLRSLYPPPDSAGLPSPNEEEERELSYNTCNMPAITTYPRPHPPEHSHVSIARGSVLLPTRLSSTRSSVSSGSGCGSISGGSVSYRSAASSSATTGQVRGRSRLGRKAGSVAAAEARAAEEGRASPDVVDMLEATPRPARKKSSGSLAGSVATSRPSKSKERPRSESRPRNSNGSGNDAAGLKSLRVHVSNGSTHTSSCIMSTLSDPVPLPPVHPPSSFIRSRHHLSEITRRATEDTAAMTVVSPTESTGDDAWMTADCGEGVGSGSESESSIDLHTPLPHILVRDGMLSPTSTVVRSLSSNNTPDLERRKSKGSRDKTSQTEVRKRRHRDGRLLREGVGLTTGLGWSDSEDEDSPGPMRRRLSRLLLQHVDGAALASSNAESTDFNDSLQSPPPHLMQRPPSAGERKQSLRKASSSLCVLGAPEPGSNAPRSALSANPSLDAKVKALLARAEAYKKETQARMVPVMAPYALSGLARRPSLTSNSTSLTSTSSAASSRSASLPRSSILSPKAPIVSEVGEDSELAAAEAAYRHSKEISASLRCAPAAAPPSGKLVRASSSVGSRDSMYSTASSGVTEFGTLVPSTPASQRARSRTVSASNNAGSGPPPSAFYLTTAMVPKHVSIRASTNALSSPTGPVPTLLPSASAPPSARRSLVVDFRPPDDSDQSSRIAKLSNASTTSVSSAAQSLTPSLFSVCSVNSADSSCTSDGGGIILPVSPACRSDTVNVSPASPIEIDGEPKVRAPSLRAPRKQLSRRSSLAPLATAMGGLEDAPNEARSNSHKPRKSSVLSTPSLHHSPDSGEMLTQRNTRRVPTMPQSIPLSRLRASTAPSTPML